MSDATGSGFAPFMPGFDMLQTLAGQASSGMSSSGASGVPQIPNLSHWVAPTFNVEELDKRIQELKAVHFWLDQNCKALAASIQALEVQKMTLTTLKNMNVSFGEMADALKMPVDGFQGAAVPTAPPASKPMAFAGLEVPPRMYGAEPVATPEAAVPNEMAQDRGEAPSASGPSDTPVASGPAADPLQWWGALAQQFQQIASQALQDAGQRTAEASASRPADVPAQRPEPVPQPAQGRKPAAKPGKDAAAKRTDRGAAAALKAATAPKTPRARKAAAVPVQPTQLETSTSAKSQPAARKAGTTRRR